MHLRRFSLLPRNFKSFIEHTMLVQFGLGHNKIRRKSMARYSAIVLINDQPVPIIVSAGSEAEAEEIIERDLRLDDGGGRHVILVVPFD